MRRRARRPVPRPMRPRRPGPGRARVGLLAGAFGLALACAAGVLAQAGRVHDQGQALFDGRRPLQAHLYGDADPLPTLASACANCHRDGQALGTALRADTLATAQPRRGGPPSRYDEAAFCATLRSGVDPAGVMLPKAMPRYALADDDCQALWRLVASR